jgi:hypothetical protein
MSEAWFVTVEATRGKRRLVNLALALYVEYNQGNDTSTIFMQDGSSFKARGELDQHEGYFQKDMTR